MPNTMNPNEKKPGPKSQFDREESGKKNQQNRDEQAQPGKLRDEEKVSSNY